MYLQHGIGAFIGVLVRIAPCTGAASRRLARYRVEPTRYTEVVEAGNPDGAEPAKGLDERAAIGASEHLSWRRPQ